MVAARPRLSPPHFAGRQAFPFLLMLLAVPSALAQLNWEGQTGALINPFAYTSPSSLWRIGRPQLGFHFIHEGPVLGNDLRASITFGFLKIGEAGYTRVFNAESSDRLSPLFAKGFNTFHAKFKLLPENLHKSNFIPALSVGSVVRTQVRRLSEVPEGENTKATDFYLVATKTISQLRFPLLLDVGTQATNASIMGVAANSRTWSLRQFGTAAVTFSGPAHLKVLLGAEIAQQPRILKDITGATVPSTLAYFVRVEPKGDVPLYVDLGMVQLAGKLGPGLDLQARHQFATALAYRF